MQRRYRVVVARPGVDAAHGDADAAAGAARSELAVPWFERALDAREAHLS
jgi:hypothetical protein